ncbi:MAG: transposase [Alphaproteobacteria bacterium]
MLYTSGGAEDLASRGALGESLDATLSGHLWLGRPRNISWTRLTCCSLAAKAVRLEPHALACNIANLKQALALPEAVAHWSLTSVKEKLIKIGAGIVRHGRYAIFQMADVAVPRELLQEVLWLIAELRSPPAATPA